jgi:hypothetical protein
MELQWTDTDPATGDKRFVRATRFGRLWRFAVRARRRTDWAAAPLVSRTMWEDLLDALERRLPRREVTEAEVAAVRKQVDDYREPPTA